MQNLLKKIDLFFTKIVDSPLNTLEGKSFPDRPDLSQDMVSHVSPVAYTGHSHVHVFLLRVPSFKHNLLHWHKLLEHWPEGQIEQDVPLSHGLSIPYWPSA